MKNILWVAFWLSLLVSPYSKAYEQQYGVGDIGPNGGVVTSVTVGSVLSDSSTELVGDFLETTDVYTYTETTIEEVENVTYETVQVTEEVISENLLPDDYTVYGGTHICTETQCYGMTGADFTTGNQSLGVSGHLYDIDLSDYDDITIEGININLFLPKLRQGHNFIFSNDEKGEIIWQGKNKNLVWIQS